MSDRLQATRAAAEKYLLTLDYTGRDHKRDVLDAYRDALLATCAPHGVPAYTPTTPDPARLSGEVL